MQIIAELEGEGRGAYTGALGWLNRDGDLDLNILIRSAWMAGDAAAAARRRRHRHRLGSPSANSTKPAPRRAACCARWSAGMSARVLRDGSASGAVLEPDDRGLAYGDGVFETLLVHAGQPVWWDEHWTSPAPRRERAGHAGAG